MRKLILLAAAATMAMTVPASVTANPPGRMSAAEAHDFCEYQMSLDPTLKLGRCMSFLLSSDVGFLTQYCHYLEATGVLDDLDITFSECVRELHGE